MNAADERALRDHLAAQLRLTNALVAQVERLMNQELRRDLLEAARTVVSKETSLMEKNLAATLLAQMVIQNIPAPRPVAVPSPVVEKEVGGSHGV